MGRLLVTDGVIDLDRGEVVRGDAVLHLTTVERELLVYLGARAGRDVSRDELHQRVWGHGPHVVSRAADFTVHRLRRKIEAAPDEPRHLITATGGYRWVPVTPTTEVPRDTVVLLVGEPVAAGDARWLGACVALARTVGIHLVDLAPDRVVFASGEPSVALDAARALVPLAPVRIGVAHGPAECLVDPVSGRTLYGGTTLERAVALARTASPGEVPDTVRDVADRGRAPRAGMPVRTDRFVGREDLLATVIGAVQRGPVALVGTAGAGKSRLAEELTARVGLPGWVVRLDTIGSIDDTLAAVARIIGVPPGVPSVERIGWVLAGRGEAILVLDGAEQVTAELGPLVARWQDDAPGVRIIVTSRERPQIDGCRIVAIDGLTVDDGVAMVRDRCPDLPASAALAALVAAVDGLPLALEVLAPRLRIVGAGPLRARLDQVLVQHPTDGRPSMYGALLESWDRLDSHERRTLVRATVFADGFDWLDAEHVLALADPGAPWVVDVLGSLCDRHLVHVEVPGRRFRLLAAVRSFAEAQGRAQPAWFGDAVHKHAERFAGYAARVPELGTPPFGSEVLADLLRAVEASLAAGWTALAIDAARTFGDVALIGDCQPVDALAVLDRVAALGVDDPVLDNRRVKLALRAGRVPLAVALAERLVVRARPAGPVAEGRAERLLSIALRVARRPDDSVAALDRAEALVAGTPNPNELALVRMNRALLHHEAGRLEEALRLGRLGLDVVEEPAARANLLQMLGNVELSLGNLGPAVDHLTEAYAAYRRVGDHHRAGGALSGLGAAHALAGDLPRATATMRETITLLREGGMSHNLVVAHLHLATYALWAGDLATSTAELETAWPIAVRTGDPRVRGMWLAVRVEERAATGRPDEAERAASEARDLLAKDRLSSAFLTVNVGMARLWAGDRLGAEVASARVEAMARELEVRPTSLLAHEIRRLRREILRSG